MQTTILFSFSRLALLMLFFFWRFIEKVNETSTINQSLHIITTTPRVLFRATRALYTGACTFADSEHLLV